MARLERYRRLRFALSSPESEADAPGELPRGPYPRRERTFEKQRNQALERWLKRIDPGWRRVWGLWHGEHVVGHLSLTGARLETILHPSELGIGIELAHRGKGWGRKLVEAGLEWARSQPAIDWIDLIDDVNMTLWVGAAKREPD